MALAVGVEVLSSDHLLNIESIGFACDWKWNVSEGHARVKVDSGGADLDWGLGLGCIHSLLDMLS